MFNKYSHWPQPTLLEVKYLALKLIDIFPEDLKPNEGWAHQFYQKIYYEYIDVNCIASSPSPNDLEVFFKTVFDQVNKSLPPKLHGVSLEDRISAINNYSSSTHGAMIYRTVKDEVEVLLVQDSKFKKWGVPKGKMNYYEWKQQNTKKTVEREIYEQVDLTVSAQNCDSVLIKIQNKYSKVYLIYIDSPKKKINYCRRQLMDARWFHQACFIKKCRRSEKWNCNCMKGINFNRFTSQAEKKIYSLPDNQQDFKESQEIINNISNRNQFTAEEESVLRNPSWAEKSTKVEQSMKLQSKIKNEKKVIQKK